MSAVPARPATIEAVIICHDAATRTSVGEALKAHGIVAQGVTDIHAASTLLARRDADVAVLCPGLPADQVEDFRRESSVIWPWLELLDLSPSDAVSCDDIAERIRELARHRRQGIRGVSDSLPGTTEMLKILRDCTEAAIGARNIEGALEELANGLHRIVPFTLAALLQPDGEEHLLYMHAVKTAGPAMFTALQQATLSHYERLSGRKCPLESLRPAGDLPASHVVETAPMANAFFVPVVVGGALHCMLALAQSPADLAASGQRPMIPIITNHVSVVMTALARMRDLAVHDSLTGLYNRKGLEEEFSRVWQQSRRYGFPLGIAIIDLDQFKRTNDTHGHQTGDQVLREFASIARTVARTTDTVARYGGDELVALLPQAKPSDAIAFGERLLEEVSRHRFCAGSLNLELSASVGVATTQGDPDDTSESLLARADQGLFRAKKAGGDRVVLQQPSSMRDMAPPPEETHPLELRRDGVRGRVLVVDDEKAITAVFGKILAREGYEVAEAHSAAAAIERVKAHPDAFDILLTDLAMPDTSGFELLDELRSINENLVKIVVTGNATFDNAVLSLRRGAYDFIEKPVVAAGLIAVVGRAMEYSRLRAENLRYRMHLEDMVREKSAALREAFERIREAHDFTLEAMVKLLDARERSTSKHSLRVRDLARVLAREMRVPEPDLEDIARGALLHDIGKMAIPDTILLKPGPLTAEESETMRAHPELGYRILEASGYLQNAADVVRAHHECWDGSGYMRGLKGEQIPLGARIFAIVDTYDAMRSDRVYHKSRSPQKVVTEIRRCAGRQFDPKVVEAFLRCQEEFERVGRWGEAQPET